MWKAGLLIRLEAMSGQEADVERLLSGLLPRVQREAGTRLWQVIRVAPASFWIWAAFPDATARHAHLAGEVMQRLKDGTAGALASPITVEPLEVVVSKQAV